MGCSTGFTGVAWILNTIFLYKPILGAPKSSVTEWIKDNEGRLIALAAGAICGLGTTYLMTHILTHFPLCSNHCNMVFRFAFLSWRRPKETRQSFCNTLHVAGFEGVVNSKGLSWQD